MPPSRPLARGPNTREAELRAELDALYAEQARVARVEAEERQNLARLQDRLDILAGEIDKKAKASRDRDLAERGAAMVARVKAAAQTNGAGRNTQIIVDTIRYALGIGPSPWSGPAPAAAFATPHQATAQAIIDSGALARNEREAPDVTTGTVRKLRSDLPPVGSAARAMINADRKRRGLPAYGDDE